MTDTLHPAAGGLATRPGPPQRRMMLIETGVSTAINAVVPPAVIWMLGLPAPRVFLGPGGTLLTLTQATVLPAFLMSLIVTALVRGRIAKGAPPLARFPGFGWIPRALPLRALFWTVCALLTVLPAGLVAARALHLGALDHGGFLFFNVLFGAVLGVFVTPFVVWLALTDTPRTARP